MGIQEADKFYSSTYFLPLH